MKLIKRGPLYYAEFAESGGRRRRLSTGHTDEKQARIRALEIVRTSLRGEELPTARAGSSEKRWTLGHALAETWEKRWSSQKSGTVRRYTMKAIEREVGDWPLQSVTYGKLQDYCRQLAERGDSAATRNRKMSAIGTALREAVKLGELRSVPPIPHAAENNIKERYLTDAEEARIFEWLARQAVPNEDYAYLRDVVTVLLDGGFRCSELLELRAEQFDGVRVRLQHGETKSGRGRVVPLTVRAREAMTRLLASPYHGKVDSDWAGRRWRTVMANLKLTGLTLHTLRHSCASRLIQGGVDIYLVSKWLGHSSLEITKRYAHLAADSLDSAMRMLQKAQPDTVPVARGTLLGAKLMIPVGIFGAGGETRTRTGYPASS